MEWNPLDGLTRARLAQAPGSGGRSSRAAKREGARSGSTGVGRESTEGKTRFAASSRAAGSVDDRTDSLDAGAAGPPPQGSDRRHGRDAISTVAGFGEAGRMRAAGVGSLTGRGARAAFGEQQHRSPQSIPHAHAPGAWRPA
jgi:hypothetical protein